MRHVPSLNSYVLGSNSSLVEPFHSYLSKNKKRKEYENEKLIIENNNKADIKSWEKRKIEFESKAHERVAIYLAALSGIVAITFGSLVTIAHGAHVLFFTVPDYSESVGLLLVIFGLFSLQEAKQQKRYSALKDLATLSTRNNV